jgi:hypothetical protein
MVAKIAYKVINIDWSVVFVSRGYLDLVFAFVAEEHLKASPEEVSLWYLLWQEVLRELHSDVEGISLIALHGHLCSNQCRWDVMFGSRRR